MMDYLVPMAGEMPDIDIGHVVTPTADSEARAKGAGEAGTAGAPACIMNAINDALRPLNAAPIVAMPITPERVLRALGRLKPSIRQPACSTLSSPYNTCLEENPRMGDWKDREVIIVGGGIGGLAAALALARSGIASQIIEQAPEFKGDWRRHPAWAERVLDVRNPRLD